MPTCLQCFDAVDLHMARLMPLPLIVSCFSKIQIGFIFLVPTHPGSPGQRAAKWGCVCVYQYRYSVCFLPKLFVTYVHPTDVHADTRTYKSRYICSNRPHNDNKSIRLYLHYTCCVGVTICRRHPDLTIS